MSAERPVPVRSFLAWVATAGGPGAPSAPPPPGWRELRDGALTLRWEPRFEGAAPAGSAGPAPAGSAGPAPAGSTMPALMLGDASEWHAASPDLNLAAGVPVRYDAATRTLRAATSIVGLPPLFVYRGARVLALASDVRLLVGLPGVDLSLDARSVRELGRIGHPVEHRTLFQGVELVPSGAQLVLDGAAGSVIVRDAWHLPEAEPLAWPQFLEAQIEAFRAAVARIDVTHSFLSLTAGLDTRTVFATLAEQQRLVPAATMTGVRRSLDMRTAARICEAYGVPHHAVVFDDRFVRALPDYMERANRLSGGLASLDQAPEVYFYDTMDGAYAARLSGNLGNQVGRGGTEGVSKRGADLAILDGALRSGGDADNAHWLLDALQRSERERIEFILKNEIVFTLVNNYPIGSRHAIQQTPYADRALIETLGRQPRSGGSQPSGSMLRMRMRDLGHRFLGEPAERSFQRTLLVRSGGYASRYPVNWGWRPTGGVSAGGLLFGVATMAGMYARAKGWDGGALRAPLAWSGLPALHDFRETRRALRENLRGYVHDTVLRADVAPLFDRPALERVLREHFEGSADHYHTVVYALDLALANRFFVAAERA